MAKREREILPDDAYFLKYVERVPFSGCWIWTGTLLSNGYGRANRFTKPILAHRWVYELLIGPIKLPQLDHLCRVCCCVNPDHLEPVTGRENTMRGNATSARNAKKTSCKYGHQFDRESKRANGMIWRKCSMCAKAERIRAKLRKAARLATVTA